MPPINSSVDATYQYARNGTLEFVAAPALAPEEVPVDLKLMQQYNDELQAVRLCLIDCLCNSKLMGSLRLPLRHFRRKTKTCNADVYV